MCLGTVGQILALGSAGRVDVEAGNRVIPASLLAMTEAVAPGDWVLMHSGLVLGRLTEQEATEALELRNPTNEGVR
jgi:hydrogenase expression/formation protein HypC